MLFRLILFIVILSIATPSYSPFFVSPMLFMFILVIVILSIATPSYSPFFLFKTWRMQQEQKIGGRDSIEQQ
jgi:hypothetical protein